MPRSSPSSSRETQLARSVLRNNLRIRPGEHVTIEGWSHTLPWAVALAREARRLKALPLVLYEDEEAYWDAIEDHEEGVLGARPEHEWAALAKTDVYIHMWGAGDRVRMNSLPEARRQQLVGFNPAWYAAAAKAGLRGARLEIGRPFPSLAKAYGVSERGWMDQLVAATMVDPTRLRKSATPITKALERGKTVHIRDDHGTDLTLGLLHRPARLSWGRLSSADVARPFGMLLTLPAGAVRVALDESVADGTLVANRSSYYDAAKATGATFEFRNGRLVSHRFDRGAELFDEDFKAAGKGRDQPGLLSIGFNPHLHDTPQVEDVERGAIMVSVGGNRNFGGKNNANFFGFAITAGAEVEVDGRRVPIPA